VDILTLTETHHFLDQHLLVIPGYQHFAVARPCKVDGQVRKHNGGILIYVFELCNSVVSVWKAAEDGTRLWPKFTDLGNSKPFFASHTYLHRIRHMQTKLCMTVLLKKLPRLKAHQVLLFWLGILMLAVVKRQIRWTAHHCVMLCRSQSSKTPARRRNSGKTETWRHQTGGTRSCWGCAVPPAPASSTDE
jgi:hypothetical protein